MDNANLIVPRLWLGNKVAALDSDFIRKNNITVVFNCTKDYPFSPEIPTKYRVPVDDNLAQQELANMARWSPEIIYKLVREYNQGHTILVHCHAGMQRSAAVVAMFLIAMQKLSGSAAIAYIRTRRPIAFFTGVNFRSSIDSFERQFQKAISSTHQMRTATDSVF
jgi:dual specificity phosphatase 12